MDEKITKIFVSTLASHFEGVHKHIIKETGGLEGVRESGGLYHSACKIGEKILTNKENPSQVAAFIFQELAKKHHFNDGNKRAAYCCVKEYLFWQGFHFKLEYRFAVDFIVNIAEHNSKITKKEIESWIQKNIELLKELAKR